MSDQEAGPADPGSSGWTSRRPSRRASREELDRHFDELIESLVGFYRSWFLSLGVDLGIAHAVADTGERGTSAGELAAATGVHPSAADLWLRGAYAHRIVDLVPGTGEATGEATGEGSRFAMEPALAEILTDESSSHYLGGQFVRSIVSTLDYGKLSESFREPRAVTQRPPRYHRAIERVTVQDITLFVEEGIPRLEPLGERLERGIRALDVACGGGRWLVTMARLFPKSRFVGVEFEPDSLARARRNVADGALRDRVQVMASDPATMSFAGEFDLAYCQDALHELPDPAGALRAAWRALGPEGRLVVFDWCVPSAIEDYRTALGELVWGVQIDEYHQGTRLLTREEFEALFESAGLPRPRRVELEAGATLFVAER